MTFVPNSQSSKIKPVTALSRYTPASLLIVFFSVLMAAMNVGQASPYVEAFAIAR